MSIQCWDQFIYDVHLLVCIYERLYTPMTRSFRFSERTHGQDTVGLNLNILKEL